MLETIHIGCAADSKFAIPTATMMYSAIANLHVDTRLEFHVIDSGFTAVDRLMVEKMLARFAEKHRICWYQFDPAHVPIPPDGSAYPREVYLRLLAARLLPQDLTRLLWLDSDTIVEADVAPLWLTDLGSRSTAAVPEFGFAGFAGLPGLAAEAGEAFPDGMPYFNSGVMLIDLAAWRRDATAERVLDYATRYRNAIRFPDQDSLNAVVAGDWVALDRRWNTQVAALRYYGRISPQAQPAWYREQAAALCRQPWIIHYTDSKPWRSGMFTFFRARYFHYLRRSKALSLTGYGRYRLATTAQSIQFGVSRLLRRR